MNVDEIMQQIGQNIKRYRKRLNLTQEQLADKMPTTSSTSISNYENGKRDNITLSTLVDFAQALGVEPMDLLLPLKSKSDKFKNFPKSLCQIIKDDSLGLCPDEVRVLEQVSGDEKTKSDYLLILTALRIISRVNYKVVLDELLNQLSQLQKQGIKQLVPYNTVKGDEVLFQTAEQRAAGDALDRNDSSGNIGGTEEGTVPNPLSKGYMGGKTE